jgi:hypothetical protein
MGGPASGASLVALVMFFAGFLILSVAAVLAVIAVAVRFGRSTGDERLQLKWFVAASIFVAATLLAGLFTQTVVAGVLFDIALIGLYAAIVIAVMKYRLYDIDLIIRRTLVYGVATAGLAGLYFAIVLLLQQVFSGFAGGSDLAVAGSTLAVAALFRPARNRIQALVDRRFYRRRYDTQRTLETFSARLREEIDLGTLRRELLQVVDETMRPANVSLWLRGQGPVGERFPAQARDDFRTVAGGSP